jgi:peptidoglycan/LPS O-acetylase OafA/YrhL
MIILEQNFSKRSFFKLGRLRWMGNLGRISYGLYMLHPIAMFVASFILQRLLHEAHPVVAGPSFMAVSFFVTVLAAIFSYRFIESPLLRLKKRFDNKRAIKTL